MKKFLTMTCLLLCATAVGVQANGNGKVKKTKTTKLGIFVDGRSESYSLSDWDTKTGFSLGAYFGASSLMKPRKPECRWGWDAAIGVNYFGGKLEKPKKNSSSKSEGDITSVGMFDLKGGIKYFFNPLSTRGKWYLKGGARACPLQISVPTEKEHTIKYSSYSSKSSYFESGSMGMSVSVEVDLGYEAKHWGVFVGPHYGAMATYSNDNNSSLTFCGFGASLQYFF